MFDAMIEPRMSMIEPTTFGGAVNVEPVSVQVSAGFRGGTYRVRGRAFIANQKD
jgi:hypothetical protein